MPLQLTHPEVRLKTVLINQIANQVYYRRRLHNKSASILRWLCRDVCVGGGGVVWVCTILSRYIENAWRERLEICHSGSLGHCIEVYRSWFQKDKGQGHWVIIPTWRFWDPSIPSERLKIGPSYLIHTLNRTIASIVCQFTPTMARSGSRDLNWDPLWTDEATCYKFYTLIEYVKHLVCGWKNCH